MRRLSWPLIGALAVLALLAFCAGIAIGAVTDTQAQCLRAGFPKSSVSIYLEPYCVSMETAIPLREVKTWPGRV